MTNDETITLFIQLLESRRHEIDFILLDLKTLLENSKKFLSQDTIDELSHKLEGILQLESEIGRTNISEQLLKKLQQVKEDFIILFFKRISEERLQQRYNDEYIAWARYVIAEALLSIELQNVDLVRLQQIEAAILLRMAEKLLRVSNLLQQKNNELRHRIEESSLDDKYKKPLIMLCDEQSQRLVGQSELASGYVVQGQQLVTLEAQELNERQQARLSELKQSLLEQEKELASYQRQEFEVTRQIEGIYDEAENVHGKRVERWGDADEKLEQLSVKSEELRSRIQLLKARTEALTLRIHKLESEMNKPDTPTSEPDSSLSSTPPYLPAENRFDQGPESTPLPSSHDNNSTSSSTNNSQSHKPK